MSVFTPDPKLKLIESEPLEIYDQMIAAHKEKTGKDVPVVSEISYIYATVADYLAIIKAAMNDIARQNYLPYARNIRLDLKGMNYGTRGARLPGSAAMTTMRCHISIPAPVPVMIPAGTRFLYQESLFHAPDNHTIPVGEDYVDVPVICNDIGDLGNIPAGVITEIVDRYEFYGTVENITPVTGGRESETDDEYRTRLELLPESFTSAGAEGAYIYWLLQASVIVTDARILTPSANHLDIYVINGQTLLSQEQKDAILDYLYNEPQKKIRAMGDVIQILDPLIINFTLDINFQLYENAAENAVDVEAQLLSALTDYTNGFKMGTELLLQDIEYICKSNKNIRKITFNDLTLDIIPAETSILICTAISLHPEE